MSVCNGFACAKLFLIFVLFLQLCNWSDSFWSAPRHNCGKYSKATYRNWRKCGQWSDPSKSVWNKQGKWSCSSFLSQKNFTVPEYIDCWQKYFLILIMLWNSRSFIRYWIVQEMLWRSSSMREESPTGAGGSRIKTVSCLLFTRLIRHFQNGMMLSGGVFSFYFVFQAWNA